MRSILRLTLGDIGKVPKDISQHVSQYFLLGTFRKSAIVFTRAFEILFFLQIVPIGVFASIYAISYVIEALIDYPTGILADKIGARNILIVAYLLFGASYFLLPGASTELDILIIFIMQSMAAGMESGGISSWFDVKYVGLAQNFDPDNTRYIDIQKKIIPLFDLIGIILGVGAGLVAISVPSGREIAFLLQGTLFAILILMVIRFIDNSYIPVTEKEKFLSSLLEGLRFILLSPKRFFFSLGLIIQIIIKSVWLSLIFVPIYYAYTGNDFYISLINGVIFLLSFVVIVLGSDKMNSLRSRYGLSVLFVFQGISLFGILYLLELFFAPNSEFQLLPVVILVIAGTLSSALIMLSKVLTYRLIIVSVPLSMRNGFYSLMPTISLLLAAVVTNQAGQIIESSGFGPVYIGLLGLTLIAALSLSVAIFLGVDDTKTIVQVEPDIPFIFDGNLEIVSSTFRPFKPTGLYLAETGKRIWLSLLRVAQADDKVTEEELNLLVDIMEEFNVYLKMLEDFTEDRVITDDEKTLLLSEREKILNVAMVRIQADGHMSKDEENILNRLRDILCEVDKLEEISHSKDR